MEKKKAQGLSLNTVVIAAIVLVVLLIAIAVLTGTSNKVLPFFTKQAECQARGGTCEATCNDVKVYGLGCEKDKDGKDTGKVCCVKQRA
ncbi:hypothetical protein HYU20_00030 [Candidatus Woesearchaeota archaeon]|nr:hypothetical protein [Candidatus Woesearchaeota archaeon]